MSEYKTYQLENAIKLMNRKRIITKVKHFAEIRGSQSPHLLIPKHRAEINAIDLILDLLAVELSKANQNFKIRRTIV